MEIEAQPQLPRVFSSRLPFGFDYYMEIGCTRRGYGKFDVLSYSPVSYEFFWGAWYLSLGIPKTLAAFIERHVKRNKDGVLDYAYKDRRQVAKAA